LGGRGLHAGGFGHQVADGLQEATVGGHVGDRAGVGAVPGVKLLLQPVALGQQRGVLRRQLVGDGVEAGPVGLGADAGAGQHLLVDEALQQRGNLKAVDGVHAGLLKAMASI
jgi:hypothetical protein